MANYPVAGKSVLITGAARGIGAETARRLAAKGAKVSLVGLEPDELERVAAQCGSDAIFFDTDVTDWDALERAASGTVERFGGIDVVMANAGIASAGLVVNTDPAAWERVVEVNLFGVWRTVRTCLPHVIERKGYILRAKMKGPLAKTYPLSVAIDAVEKGIENRSRRVMGPSWIKYMFAMRDFLGPITDRQVADVMPEVERVVSADIAARGAQSSAPVGAGGEADSRTRSSSAAVG
jgi:NAD(P)-dependent dehydrogenase (short-subunit alcohol dehydrogenase family)